MRYIIWAYMDYYYVRSIFFQDWSNEMLESVNSGSTETAQVCFAFNYWIIK